MPTLSTTRNANLLIPRLSLIITIQLAEEVALIITALLLVVVITEEEAPLTLVMGKEEIPQKEALVVGQLPAS